jgi:hypothetical protein
MVSGIIDLKYLWEQLKEHESSVSIPTISFHNCITVENFQFNQQVTEVFASENK